MVICSNKRPLLGFGGGRLFGRGRLLQIFALGVGAYSEWALNRVMGA